MTEPDHADADTGPSSEQPGADDRSAPRALESVRPLIALVAIDAISKLAAYLMLPAGQEVRDGAMLQFVLRINRVGLGSWSQGPLHAKSAHVVVPSAFGAVAMAIVLVVGRRRQWPRARVILASIASYVAVAAVAAHALSGISAWPPYAALLFWRTGTTVLFTTMWTLYRRTRWATPLLLVSASALGNLLSLLYPPFGIVDFVYSEPFHRITGFGIFNLADLMFLGAGVAFVITVARAAARTLHGVE